MERIVRQKNVRMPSNTVYVAEGSLYSTPFKVFKNVNGEIKIRANSLPGTAEALSYAQDSYPTKQAAEEDAVRLYGIWVSGFTPERQQSIINALAGKNLACWCNLSTPCHADFLLKFCEKK